jgi:TPR repeat protein
MGIVRFKQVLLVAGLLVLAPLLLGADYLAGVDAYRAGDFEEALKQWLPLGRAGMADAQYRLARLYSQGRGVATNHVEAANWYRKAAQQGSARAQNNLGLAYELGRGVEQNDAQAVEWYRKAAAQDRPVPQNNLARMYELGRGVEASADQAFKWYLRAAQLEHAGARNSVGTMYDEGQGVEADAEKAARWYLKAARQDHAVAQFNLGQLYLTGRGVPRDKDRALKWFRRAAANQLTQAREQLDRMSGADPRNVVVTDDPVPLGEDNAAASSASGTSAPATSPDQHSPLRESEAIVISTARPHATDGNAIRNLPSGAKNLSRDLADLRATAESGDVEVQYRLGRIYSTGNGVEADQLEAGQWYLRAAERGHALAGYRLAFMYLRGIGLSRNRDFVQAYMWFLLSADRDVGDSAEWREKLVTKMSASEIDEARRLAGSWQPLTDPD